MDKLTIKRSDWNDGAELNLEPACDKFLPIEELEKHCEYGDMTLFAVEQNKKDICHFVLRLDGEEDCLEMVVVCGGGSLRGGSLFKVLTPYIEEIARQCKAKWLRGHVNSLAKAKLMERAGYALHEYVFRKEVCHGWQIQ